MSAAKSAPADVPRHPWRENLETAAVAIVMALVLKYFTLEAFQIPTGSMQPTLMGLDATRGNAGGSGVRVFDRILVDKLVPFFRDPERWEVWVFLFPLDRSNRYIKRVVGMPGEELKVAFGDLFVRRTPQEEWKILRKPRHVQDAAWREVWRSDQGERIGDYFDLTGFVEKDGQAVGSGAATASSRRQILDGYTDGYPDALRAALRESGRIVHGQSSVRDLRLRMDVRPDAQHRLLTLLLDWSGDQLRAEVSGPSGDGKVRLLLNDRPLAEGTARLRLDRANSVVFERADETARLLVNGEEVARQEFTSSTRPEQATMGIQPPNRVKFETEGGTLRLEHVGVDRDNHYTNRIGNQEFWSVSIPENEYFMMGDNSSDSADGRAWMSVSVDLATPVDGKRKLEGGTMTSGEHAGPNPRFARTARNGATEMIFRDEWGEEYRYTQGAASAPSAQHTVPRDHFLGRAIFVFWPFPPLAPVARFKAVH